MFKKIFLFGFIVIFCTSSVFSIEENYFQFKGEKESYEFGNIKINSLDNWYYNLNNEVIGKVLIKSGSISDSKNELEVAGKSEINLENGEIISVVHEYDTEDIIGCGGRTIIFKEDGRGLFIINSDKDNIAFYLIGYLYDKKNPEFSNMYYNKDEKLLEIESMGTFEIQIGDINVKVNGKLYSNFNGVLKFKDGKHFVSPSICLDKVLCSEYTRPNEEEPIVCDLEISYKDYQGGKQVYIGDMHAFTYQLRRDGNYDVWVPTESEKPGTGKMVLTNVDKIRLGDYIKQTYGPDVDKCIVLQNR